MSFWAELKRRKVFRVAGAYLVGAWVVLQVAATLLPALELPPWTVKLVAVLAIIGFPLSLVIGWLFDLTPGGIERTADARHFRFPTRAALAGTVIVVIGVFGFMIVRRRLDAAGIDPNAVVVLPFRVTGDAQLAVMREGMVDLIAPKLTGVGGPRAVDSRTTLSAWRSAVSSEAEDLAPSKAIKLARKLGAAQVILGEVVGAPGQIVLHARLYSTIDGAASDPARVTTKPDSLLTAVDRLVAELLSRQAGESDRLAALLTSSLPAVQAYLDGNRHYRRGNYREASESFADAVDLDSTFALATYGEMRARAWYAYGPRYVRAQKLAWVFRDRLPPRERDMLLARTGTDTLQGLSYNAMVRAWEDVTTKYPDSPEAWYELGDSYYHQGEPLGMADYDDRALAAWARAIALDSSFAPPWEHQVQIHAARADTAQLHAVYRHLRVLNSDRVSPRIGWVYAVATHNDSMRARLLKDAPNWRRLEMSEGIMNILKSGASTADLDSLAQIYAGLATTAAQRANAPLWLAMYHLNRGRPGAALGKFEEAAALPENEIEAPFQAIALSITNPELGREAAVRATQALSNRREPNVTCVVGLWYALENQQEQTQQALRLLSESDTAVGEVAFFKRYCRQLILSAHTVVARKPEARAVLQRMDSLIINGPIAGPGVANFTAVLLARLYAQIGDYERAWRASLRGGYAAYHLSAQVLEQARMAARTGRTAEAIESYRIFLSMMDDPEPGPAKAIADKVRGELAALTSK